MKKGMTLIIIFQFIISFYSYVYASNSQAILENLYSQTLEGKYCDFELKTSISSDTLPVHKCVLESYSYFNSAFSSGLFESRENSNIVFPGLSIEALKHLRNILYHPNNFSVIEVICQLEGLIALIKLFHIMSEEKIVSLLENKLVMLPICDNKIFNNIQFAFLYNLKNHLRNNIRLIKILGLELSANDFLSLISEEDFTLYKLSSDNIMGVFFEEIKRFEEGEGAISTAIKELDKVYSDFPNEIILHNKTFLDKILNPPFADQSYFRSESKYLYGSGGSGSMKSSRYLRDYYHSL